MRADVRKRRLSVGAPRRHRVSRLAGTGGVVAGVLAVTGLLMWLAWSANDRSNESLLNLQTRQVAATLSAALPSIHSDLDDVLSVVAATKSPAVFESFIRNQRASSQSTQFASESLWVRTGSGARLLANVGQPLQLVRDKQAAAFFGSLHPSTTLSVTGILPGAPRRLGYADVLSGAGDYVVYAESLLPANPRFTVPASSPFSELSYAVYLGRDERAADLLEASTATPIAGLHSVATIPLGDTFITVVATPRGQLAGGTSESLPWIVPGIGLFLALVSGILVDHFARRRRSAEDLSEDLGELYAEQRTIARTLQRALLPRRLPAIEHVDVSARYVAGAKGADVGGDWYDVIPLPGANRFMFVIGDVSGRGIEAAAVMASLRFASRAFALEGHEPADLLRQLGKTLDFASEGLFATVMCGLADVSRHEITLASAGHPPPVLRTDGAAAAARVQAAPPIGILSSSASVETLTIRTPPGSLLVAYTDGLIERRGEAIETGIARLAKVADREPRTADALLDELLSEFKADDADDDVALVALRWLA
ncbi:MAG: PP2C family protein-serine/threonine phosphatase [Acidimicrobiales bacterium]